MVYVLLKKNKMETSLGDRMKENYEKPFNYKLPNRLPVVIRLDGNAFHSLTRKCIKPFDLEFISSMQQTALFLCKKLQSVQCAYVQSDEISLLLHNYKTLNTQPWFGNEIQKMTSISAGLASAYFTKHTLLDKVCVFDSRCFVLPESEVVNYFIWRQNDWTRNSIQMLAQSLYSQKELNHKNCNTLQDMCFAKGHNWNDLATTLKRGSLIYKVNKVNGESVESEWIINNDIPIFTQDRACIERFLRVEE